MLFFWLCLLFCQPVPLRPRLHSPHLRRLRGSRAKVGPRGTGPSSQAGAPPTAKFMTQLTAAHKTLPFGTFVRVTNPNSGAHVVVRINDRGPFKPGRVIDVSRAAAEQLGMIGPGTLVVRLEIVSEQVQTQTAGNAILAADSGLQGYNVISSQYRVGQLLLLTSATQSQPIVVRVASNNMPVSSGVEMFGSTELFNQLGDRVSVVVGN
jgi:hypothetical protein